MERVRRVRTAPGPAPEPEEPAKETVKRSRRAPQPAKEAPQPAPTPEPEDEQQGKEGYGLDATEPGGEKTYARIIREYKEKITGPLSGIRAHCVECCCGSLPEIRDCIIKECALYPFRMGKNTLHAKYQAKGE